ncbi:MAG: nitroreductase [Gemmatimonadota bacterium]
MRDKLLDPWVEAIDEYPLTGSNDEKLMSVLRHAVLAPSSHNSQPWRFEIVDGMLNLYADRARALPVVDPDDRELVISCGAALGFIRVALRHFGTDPVIERSPDPSTPDWLAHIELGQTHLPTERDHALFRAIATRRTNRRPFETRLIPEPVLGRARGLVERESAWLQTLQDDADREVLANLIGEGDRVQMADRKFRRELAAWVHSNRSSSRDGMPGYAHGVGDLAASVGPLVIRTFDIGKGAAAHDRDLVRGSPVLAVMWTETDTAPAWLAAGVGLSQALLSLESENVSVSYLNQVVEVPELRQRLREQLGREGYPQLVLRLGYGPRIRATPRRPVSEIMREPEVAE